mgnify:CR=1 FL=1
MRDRRQKRARGGDEGAGVENGARGDARSGRPHFRPFEVDGGVLFRRLGFGEKALRLIARRERVVAFFGARRPRLEECRGTAQFAFGLREIHLGFAARRGGRIESGSVGRLVDRKEHVARLDRFAFAVVQLRENPAHLSPNLHALAAFGLTELLDPTWRIRGFGYYGFNGQRRGRYGSGGFFGASGKEQTGGSQSEEEL